MTADAIPYSKRLCGKNLIAYKGDVCNLRNKVRNIKTGAICIMASAIYAPPTQIDLQARLMPILFGK